MSRKFVFFILLVALLAKPIYAQPTLPDIAGVLNKGVILLTWDCQYDGIKSIAVQRSSDSVHNYTTVGYVKNIKKGVHAFIDGHPGVGKNWYQLYIVFNSGLTWNSNRVKIMVDTASLLNQRYVLPPNDSLQSMFILTEATDKPSKSKKSGIVVSIDTSDKKGQDVTTIDLSAITGEIIKPVTSNTGTIFYANTSPNAVNREPVPGIKVPDVVVPSSSSEKPVVKPAPKHITISDNSDPSNLNPYAFIKSRYIFTNPLTGHVNMELPAVASHHYSVKFFDNNNNVIVEVPKIMASPLIIDKRNFQTKGIFKFELMRDYSQFETGYITIY